MASGSTFFLLLLVFLTCAPHCAGARIRLIAHRGGVVDERFPENSPGSVEEAIRRGYWMIEVDLQPSRDGRIIVHHDENFLRFYGEPARVIELGWDRIVRLRARPGGSRPLQFHELAALACGRIRLMLDLKRSPGWTPAHYEQIETVLRENDLLDTAMFISNDEAKAHFRGKARISVNRTQLEQALRRGEPVSQLYFLFFHGRAFTAGDIELARRAGVEAVPSINIFHYPEGDHMEQARRDIERLRALGVTHFQIDSVYERWLR